MIKVSIIIPTFNEDAVIVSLLKTLQPFRSLGHQVVLSDGGSTDTTCELAKPFVDNLIHGSAGRALQMNRGASLATGDVLWFIHADSDLSLLSFEQVIKKITQADVQWGRFNVRLKAQAFIYRVIEKFMNERSRLTGIATGDQAIFVRRKLFEQLNGFADQPLMEDIEFSRRLKAVNKPLCLTETIVTSARRWQEAGVIRTILLMWRLRLAFFFGVSPETLVKQYRVCSSSKRIS